MRFRVRVLGAGLVGLAGVGCLNKGASTGAGITDGGWSNPAPAAMTAGPGAASAKQQAAQELAGKPAAALHLAMAVDLDKEKKVADAILYYEKAREQDPSLKEKVARRLAVLYDQADDQAKAMAEFQELLKKKPKDPALLNDVGYSYYNRGQWAEAETYLRRAVTADKHFKPAWVNLGMTLAQQGKQAEALDAFGHAVTTAEAHANLAFVLATQGKRDEAVAVYRRALTMEPTLKIAQAAVARLELAGQPATTAADQPGGFAAPGS
jgi:tetratricopeptide (TPR) repeat protein